MNTLHWKSIVVIGGGLAGAKAAEGARAAGFDGLIRLIGDEAHSPYERPPLSKGVLRGEAEPSSASVHPETFYRDNGIDLLTGHAVEAIDLSGRRVLLASGERIEFDAAVLATGAEPRRLDVQGADLPGVHYLRTIDDAAAVADSIRHGGRAGVIGAGWIGSEVAASARQMGADVVLVDPSPVPLMRVLGREVGEVFRRLHADNGVTLRLGSGVAALRGGTAVEELVLSDGSVEPVSVVVAGVGALPRTELAAAAGLPVDNGVLVDQWLQTSAPGVYAAGDVASAWHRRYRRHVRVEHWASALNQGTTAGRNAAVGPSEQYDRLPYFYSDQYDLGMEYVGFADPARDEVVFRGDVDSRKFIAFWHRDGDVTAAMNVNVWDVVDDLKSIVSAGPLDVARLADPAVPLCTFAAR